MTVAGGQLVLDRTVAIGGFLPVRFRARIFRSRTVAR
jgi:hypothetical protein